MAAQILIVEDDATNAFIFSEFCRRDGHSPCWVAGGAEALRVLAHGEVSLLLLDLRMDAPDGLAVAREVRATPATATLPIVVVTALAAEAERDELLALGGLEILIKPFSGRALQSAINRLLARPEGHSLKT